MSLRFDKRVKILKKNIPVREGTSLHVGFVALLNCDGKTYRHFRSLAGGPKNSKGRCFSPSTVLRIAEANAVARLEDSAEPQPFRTSGDDKNTAKGASRQLAHKTEEPSLSLNDVRQLILADRVTLDLPGIYAWKIEGSGVYVGKYTHKFRPLREYDKNVRRLLSDEPYRPQNPNGFRRVHRALAKAVVEGLNVELHVLENCPPETLNAREQYLIAKIGSGGLNG